MEWAVVTTILAAWWSPSSRAMWNKIIHRDDATDEEKRVLIKEMKNSPPISPMHAFFHPFVLVRAHKALKRYQGRTWIWPRLMWLSLLVVSAIILVNYYSNGTSGTTLTEGTPAAPASAEEEAFRILSGVLVLVPMLALMSHLFTTVAFRMEETCVWCHIIQRNVGGSIESILTISAYRLPFLDPSRKNIAPWQRKWWSTTSADVTLETKKDVSRLSLADIYDEMVCRMRPPAPIPPTAKRYVVGRIERHGDVIIRERRRLIPKFGLQPQAVVVTAVGVAASAAITVLVALLLPVG